jgi:glycerol-3-phosphate dehydrogenase
LNSYDLLIIGGGINGAGIARDAAGRGLAVLMVERDDLASHTSSASSKLIHGGLRYLEYYEFRLVAEALAEREVLLRIAPHLIRPLTFVLPHEPHLRPAWMIRTGLALYDRIGGRMSMPRSRSVALAGTPLGAALKPEFLRGFTYADAWVDDARLVIANALSAQEKGATIRTRTECIAARRVGDQWQIELRSSGRTETVAARAIVNAAGPWAQQVVESALKLPSNGKLKLVKGSHIVVPRLYEGDHAYILQNPDRRVIFLVPYGEGLTAIGTTDIPVEASDTVPCITDDEIAYLCAAASRYTARPIVPADVVNTWSGVRALYDDGQANPSAVTRDYRLLVDAAGPPVLSVFGGKITTYRKLAEHAIEKLAPHFPQMKAAWTDREVLPGGDIPRAQHGALVQELVVAAGGDSTLAYALVQRYGTHARDLLKRPLGEQLAPGLFEAEVRYLVEREWAITAEDILWRRTKVGLRASAADVSRLQAFLDRLSS